MQTANRLTFQHGCVTILATACCFVPLLAKEPQTPATLAQREQDKRRAAIEEAEELLTKGDQAYQAGRYADAAQAFAGAREMIPDAPLTAELRAAATQRYAQAAVANARDLSRKGDVAAAKAAVEAVLKPAIAPDDPGAIAMRNQLDDPIRTNPALTKEHGANVDSVRRLLYTAEGAYNLGKYDEATKHYESVLRIDPTNTAARRGMEQVVNAKITYQKSAVDQTRAEMLNEVAAAWEISVPPPSLDVTAVNPTGPAQTGSFIPVSNKLDRIVIPSLILDGASLQDAIDLLRLRAAELDTLELDPARRGVNFNIELGGDDSEIGNQIRAIRFNLRLNNVPISHVLSYINEQTHTTYTTDDFAVIIRPHGSDSKDMVSHTYRVPPDFLSSLGASTETAAKNADPFASKPAKGLLTERRGALEVLRDQGIQFPEGASAILNPGNNTLTVVNTPANQDIISQIVDAVAKTSPMVCVRVTMIRVRETRLKELGFDWLLSPTGVGGDGWIQGTKNLNISGGTSGNPLSFNDIVIPRTQGQRNPITASNRSGDEAIANDSIDELIATSSDVARSSAVNRAPGIFGVTKILSNSSVQMLMRGFDQKKGVDIMTTAATVTRSGQASSIRSVREMVYPSEYEPPQLPQANNTVVINIGPGGVPVAGGRTPPPMVTPSHPHEFKTREVGVTLEVTPTADEAKRFVDVTLNPSVVDFDGFVNYGSPIRLPSSTNVGGIFDPLLESPILSDNRILMPVFSVNRTSTSLTVADGATIVIGGLLQERVQNVNDKTPIFGDVPIIGRLFQSKATQPISTAVMFLVNIQLVDPTGQPFNKR